MPNAVHKSRATVCAASFASIRDSSRGRAERVGGLSHAFNQLDRRPRTGRPQKARAHIRARLCRRTLHARRTRSRSTDGRTETGEGRRDKSHECAAHAVRARLAGDTRSPPRARARRLRFSSRDINYYRTAPESSSREPSRSSRRRATVDTRAFESTPKRSPCTLPTSDARTFRSEPDDGVATYPVDTFNWTSGPDDRIVIVCFISLSRSEISKSISR